MTQIRLYWRLSVADITVEEDRHRQRMLLDICIICRFDWFCSKIFSRRLAHDITKYNRHCSHPWPILLAWTSLADYCPPFFRSIERVFSPYWSSSRISLFGVSFNSLDCLHPSSLMQTINDWDCVTVLLYAVVLSFLIPAFWAKNQIQQKHRLSTRQMPAFSIVTSAAFRFLLKWTMWYVQPGGICWQPEVIRSAGNSMQYCLFVRFCVIRRLVRIFTV